MNLDWFINELSDGQRRRCQLLECFAIPRQVYLLDEITSDLDLFAREGLLQFLRRESEERKATILYCTHIFDHLEGWASHLLQLSKGRALRSCRLDDLAEYKELLSEGATSPLYTLVRKWVYADSVDGSELIRQNAVEDLDGRIPNLGLAGPIQLRSG